jgi:hypothetical protein
MIHLANQRLKQPRLVKYQLLMNLKYMLKIKGTLLNKKYAISKDIKVIVHLYNIYKII